MACVAAGPAAVAVLGSGAWTVGVAVLGSGAPTAVVLGKRCFAPAGRKQHAVADAVVAVLVGTDAYHMPVDAVDAVAAVCAADEHVEAQRMGHMLMHSHCEGVLLVLQCQALGPPGCLEPPAAVIEEGSPALVAQPHFAELKEWRCG